MGKKEIQDKIRDLINWIVIFENEYGIPKEVVDELRAKIEEISKMIDELEIK